MAACQSKAPQPVSIEAGDVCQFCRMAISQPVFAGQFIDKDGNAFKFDDIGCMIRFLSRQEGRNTVAAFFVMDYNDKRWIAAEQATYVKSDKTATPMGSGLTAFREGSRGREFAAKVNGHVLHFDDLWKGDAAGLPHVPATPR
jgi:copper chaperone NosL